MFTDEKSGTLHHEPADHPHEPDRDGAIIPADPGDAENLPDLEADWDEGAGETPDGPAPDDGDDDWDRLIDPPEGQEEGDPGAAPPAETFRLKHLGEDLEVGRDEIITLAQKGKDYDRIRRRLDDQTELLSDLAAAGGTTVQELMSRTPALSPARRDRSRMDREIAEFIDAFGSVSPREIPSEVWEDVHKGVTLVNAFQTYQTREATARLEARRLEHENRARTAGSRRSDGLGRTFDEIEADWLRE